MGTKNNPGKFDCYEAADPDEPMFVLLARDASAPHLVRLWAAVRIGDIFTAVQEFANLVKGMAERRITYGSREHDRDCEKAQEANYCADEMEDWDPPKPAPQPELPLEDRAASGPERYSGAADLAANHAAPPEGETCPRCMAGWGHNAAPFFSRSKRGFTGPVGE